MAFGKFLLLQSGQSNFIGLCSNCDPRKQNPWASSTDWLPEHGDRPWPKWSWKMWEVLKPESHEFETSVVKPENPIGHLSIAKEIYVNLAQHLPYGSITASHIPCVSTPTCMLEGKGGPLPLPLLFPCSWRNRRIRRFPTQMDDFTEGIPTTQLTQDTTICWTGSKEWQPVKLRDSKQFPQKKEQSISTLWRSQMTQQFLPRHTP